MTTPAQITCTAGLLDDYLYMATPPIGPNIGSCFVVAQNLSNPDPVNELIFVNNNNQVVLLSPNSASNSGYGETIVPVSGATGAAVSKLLGFYQNGQLNVLVHYAISSGNSQIIWMQQDMAGNWSTMPMAGDIGNALGCVTETGVYTDISGSHYIYGISANFFQPTFFIAACQAGTTNWQVTFQTVAVSTSYLLLPGLGGDLLNVVWLSGSTIQFQGIQGSEPNWQWDPNPAQFFDPEQGTLTGGQIFAIPGSTGGLNASDFLLLGASEQLYYISGYNQQFPKATYLTGQPNQPVGITQVTLGYDGQKQCMIFAIDTAQTLWCLRQSGTDPEGNLLFGAWVQLGNTLGLAVCPATMDSGPELFAVDLAQNVLHIYQDINPVTANSGETVDGTWFVDFLEMPSPSTAAPQPMPTYTGKIKVFDNNGNPMPQQALSLQADRSCVLIVNGLSYSVGTNAGTLVQTDFGGQVTVVVAARNLTAPELTVTVPGTNITLAARLDVQLHNRVAGNDPQFQITGPSLLASGLVSTQDQTLAGELAQALQTVGQTLVAISNPQQSLQTRMKNLAAVGIQQWELDFQTPGQPRFRALTREEAKAHFDWVALQGAEWWLSDLWGDVCNFVENNVASLGKIVASIVNDVVQIAIEVAGQVQNFVLQTVNQMGDLLETIFVKIAEGVEAVANAIEKAVEWLKLVFNWNDILNTQTVLNYFLNNLFTNLTYAAGNGAISIVQNNFASAKQSVSNAFNQAQSVFSSGISFSQFAENANGGTGGLNLLQASQLQAQYNTNAAQCDYIFAKTQTNISNASSTGLGSLAIKDSDPYTNLINTIENELGDDFNQALQNFQNLLQQAPEQAEGFCNQSILIILEAAEQAILFVLNAIENIIVALLELFASMLTTIQDAVNTPLNIPFISWLYAEINNGAQLTILDLATLIIAAPLTILYKIAFGGSQATPPFTADQVAQITGTPIPWPSFLPQPPQAARLGAQLDSDTQQIFLILGSLTWFIYAVFDIFVVGWNNADANNPPSSNPLPDPSNTKTIISWIAVAFASAIQIFTVPLDYKNIPNDVQWGFALIPLGMDIVSIIKTQMMMRFNGTWGISTRTACGLILLVAGIAAAVEGADDPDYSNWTSVGNIISPLSLCGTFLYAMPKVVSAQVALLVITAVSDFGAAVCTLGESGSK